MLRKTQIKKIILFLFPVISSLYGQEEKSTSEVDDLIDELFFAESLVDDLVGESKTNFIYSSVDFNSNTFYAGRSIGSDQFNMVPQISYLNTKGFSVNLSGVYLSGVQPAWDVTSISLGYSKMLDKQKKNVGLYANYSRYFFSFDAPGLFSNGMSLGATYQSDNNKLYASASGNVFFGGNTLFQVVSSMMYSMPLVKSTSTKTKKNSEKMWVSSVGKVKRKPFQFTRNLDINFNPKVTFLINQETITSQNFFAMEETVFGLTNTQIKFPLVLESGNLDIEAAYYLNLPSPMGSETELNTTRFFGLSVGYFFGL